MPVELKFGYAEMIERQQIRHELVEGGASEADLELHFRVEAEYQQRHAADPTFRETTERLMASWGVGARRQQEDFAFAGQIDAAKDAALAALKLIVEGHNDPRTLAAEVLALLPKQPRGER